MLIASLCPGNHLSFRLPTATVSSLVCSSFPVRCVTGSGNRVSSRKVTRCSIANRRLEVSLSCLVQLADILCYLCFVPASPVGGKKKWGFHVGDGKFSFCIIFFFFFEYSPLCWTEWRPSDRFFPQVRCIMLVKPSASI